MRSDAGGGWGGCEKKGVEAIGEAKTCETNSRTEVRVELSD